MPNSAPVHFMKLPRHWQTCFVFLAGCYPVTHQVWVELEKGTEQEIAAAHQRARACRGSAKAQMGWPEKAQIVMAEGAIRFRRTADLTSNTWRLIAEVLPGS